MGCFNSKEKSNNGNPSGLSNEMTSTSNGASRNQNTLVSDSKYATMHSGAPRAIELMKTDGDKINAGRSLLRYPASTTLVNLRSWFRKRGHMIRTWKNRFFILAPTSLKYYKKEIKVPPFGEVLKGEVSLKGAILQVFPPENGSKDNMVIKIFGREGEKDLLIDLGMPTDMDAVYIWIYAIEWTIRRCTKIYMNDIFKQRTMLGNIEVGRRLKFFEMWQETENERFRSALERLAMSSRADVSMHYYELDGTVSARQYTVSLWTANRTDYDPEYMYNLRSIGIKYSLTNTGADKPELKYAIEAVEGVDTRYSIAGYRDQMILKCADIINMSIASANPASIERPVNSKTCCNGSCFKVRNKILSIETGFCHSIHIECCCLYDYDSLIICLRDIILYLNLNIPTDNYNEALKVKDLMSEYQGVSCIKAKIKVSGEEE